jgi:23S rRNA (guanosine2251-2'-O)-methyltransferase
MAGGVSSLNVSTAGAVVLYEAYRQRRNKLRSAERAVSPTAVGASKKKQKGLGS